MRQNTKTTSSKPLGPVSKYTRAVVRVLDPRPYSGWKRWVRVFGLSAGVLLILFAAAMPALTIVLDKKQYQLGKNADQLLGTANENLAKKLVFDPQESAYYFNKDKIVDESAPGLPEALQSQIGGQGKDDKNLYSLKVDTDSTKGVTYYDNNTNLSFSMIPEFETMKGKRTQNRLVYPISNNVQLVYTAKSNGLKEDIIHKKFISDRAQYNYKLDLPSTLEARLLDDGSGGLGIYSADMMLYNNISAGQDSDWDKIKLARENAKKETLVFVIPAPVVVQANGVLTTKNQAVFELKDNRLIVQAAGLKDLTYPLSIDPSVVITSSSDFSGGNNEDAISYSTANQISRDQLSGGTTDTGAAGASFTTARRGHAMVANNGYLYISGGKNSAGTSLSDVQYIQINSNGTLGASWITSSTTGFSARAEHSMVAYNGYMYALGGLSLGPGNPVQYTKINADGSLGTSWTTTISPDSFTTSSTAHAYNGFMYTVGGGIFNGSTYPPSTTVKYAAILPSGALGTWAATTSFTTARMHHGSAIFNGNLYVMGGSNGATTYYNDVQYVPISSNGALGTWVTSANAMPTTGAESHNIAVFIYKGYLYATGGGDDIAVSSTARYAPVYANGAIGLWKTFTPVAMITRQNHASVAYNGHIYVTGGSYIGFGGVVTYRNDTQYDRIKTVGDVADSFVTAAPGGVPTSKYGASTVVYNGYLYYMGGAISIGATDLRDESDLCNFVPLNSNGTLGTWATCTQQQPTGRSHAAAFAYNGYMYVLGGTHGAALNTHIWATINSSTGALSAWSSVVTPANFVETWGHEVVQYNGQAYIVAGNNSSNVATNTVRRITSMNAGTLTISATTYSIGTARAVHQAVAHGGYLYVAGGTTSGGFGATYANVLNSVEYAKINNDGTLGAFASAGTSFTNARMGFGMAIVNDYIYVYSGFNGASTYYSDIQHAKIDTSGTATDGQISGSWTTSALTSQGRRGPGVAHHAGYLYLIGGYNGTLQNDSYYTSVVSNGGQGTLNTWTSGTTYSIARRLPGAIVNNGFIYVVGGQQATATINTCNTVAVTTCNDVQYAPINANGSIGTWVVNANRLSTPVHGHGLVILNGYMYAIGGANGATNQSTVQYASVNSTGGTGAWASTTAIPQASFGNTAGTFNGRIYMAGGQNTTPASINSVYYTTPTANGTITGGTWSTATNLFTTTRHQHAMVINKGKMYILGGYNGTTRYQDVQYSTINTGTGDLGAWNYAQSILTPRYGLTAAVMNGYIYVTGGSTATSVATDVTEYAPVLANGSIGNWSGTVKSTNASRYDHAAVMYDGYIYSLGGYSGSIYYGDIYYSAPNSIARIAQYSKLINLNAFVSVASIGFTGTYTEGVNAQYKIANQDGVFSGALLTASTSGTGTLCTASTARYVQLYANLDDTANAAYGDTGSILTDVTLNYNVFHPDPQYRLRGGKHFAQEVQQPLDTCGA